MRTAQFVAAGTMSDRLQTMQIVNLMSHKWFR
jgi:hypothetical protein